MTDKTQKIVLGGGCFWCLEAVYKRINGITFIQPGYAGGYVENPDYKEVCKGTTGHAEVVEVCFDPEDITLNAILEIFWQAHDPTTLDRQGSDIGSQYRSIILYANEDQKQIAETSLKELIKRAVYPAEPVTQILPLKTFWPAEAYHKDYFESHRNQPYCRLIIETKLHKLAGFLTPFVKD